MYNECQDCDRMDCRDRGCIAPTSASNSSKINHEYTKRPRVKIPKSRDLYEGSYTLDDLSELKNGAELNINLYYNETYIFLSWGEDESDEEYIKRMIKLDKAAEKRKHNAIKNASKKAKEEAEKTLLNSAMSKLSKEELEVLKRNLNK